MLIQEPVQAAIWHCLNHYAYKDATFLAERLQAEVDTDESLFLLATCYYRSGKLNQAYDVLHGKGGLQTQENRFLMAKCCSELNKLVEAESILNSDLDPRKDRLIEDVVSDFGDSACFAYQLLGSIYGKTERLTKAVDAERKSLKLNPLLWNSYEILCGRGDNPDPKKIFNVSQLDNLNQILGSNPILNLVNNNHHHHPGGIQDPSASSTPAPAAVLTPSNLHQTPHQQYNSHIPAPLAITPLSTTEIPYYNSTPNTNNRFISGINSLNYSTDVETTPQGISSHKHGIMPPPLLKKKKPPNCRQTFNTSLTDGFGTPTFGTLFFKKKDGKRESLNVSNTPTIQVQLSFSTSSIVELSSVIPANNTEFALTNATNNEQKLSKRIIMNSTKENPYKPNVFSSSSNISPSPNSPNVRRSSRHSKSVKENSKTPNSTPSSVSGGPSIKANRVGSKSPSRAKTNNKTSRYSINKPGCSDSEMNEKNKQQDLLMKEDSILGGNGSPNVPPPPSITSSTPAHHLTNNAYHQSVGGVNLSTQALVIQKSSVDGLMALLKIMGIAYAEHAKFNCKKSLALLEDIPPHHRNNGWVLGLIAKNFFELGEYKEAKRCYQEIRDREPYRLDQMEYYSTALWHLQEEIELSALAQELTRIDKFSPEAWCAAGNCFSLQKEHENAIKFFQRAVQVQPDFSYAYTLLGHEYVMIEEIEKALSCFRAAVRMNPRHYNAWYGIGLTYYKQESYQMTEMYYKKALAINKQSPVLMCHVAVVQHALQKTDKALETLSVAIKSAPKNPLCKFEKASILFASERYQEALTELNELKDIIPKESPVYFLLGKVHNKLNNKNMALMHFSWAVDLDPKGANSQIKDALDPTLNRASQDENYEGPGIQVNEDFQEISESFVDETPSNVIEQSMDESRTQNEDNA